MPDHPMIHNPHLEGDPFFWQAGPLGVLLIHGFTATTAEVRPLAKILHQNGYTISGPLLPGHYTQPEDLNRVTWQDWVAEVEQALKQLQAKCQTIFVGGESTGGLLALYLAAHHPETVGVLAYAPALKLAASNFDLFRLNLLAPFVPYVPKESMDSDAQWQGYPVNPLKGARQLLKLQKIVLPSLSDIRQPLLVVQGRLDTTVHPSVPETIASQVSSQLVQVHWMEASSHVVIIDQELDQVAEITLQFLRLAVSQPSPT
jgi:carboxylesterase